MIGYVAGPDPWVPTTSGERLLFMLLRHHGDWRTLAEALTATSVRLGRRYDGLAEFFVGASALFLVQRMVKLASDARDARPGDRLAQVALVHRGVREVLQVTVAEYSDDFDALIQETLVSAEQTGRTVPQGLRRRVIAAGPGSCYSCGRRFGVVTPDGPAPDGLVATADHVWPKALGGDTVEENLLPACKACNSEKGHLAAWQMSWIQPAVFAESDAAGGLKGMRKDAKFGLHMRAAMAYAHANGSTLRDAYLAIGPRSDPPVRIDDDQGYDFFNLRVHDEASTGVAWVPS